MNQAGVGWGVWTCYTAYFLIRRTGFTTFTVSDIVLRDRNSLRPQFQSSFARINPLQLLLGLVFLPGRMNANDPDLGWWSSTKDILVRSSPEKRRRPKDRDVKRRRGEEGECDDVTEDQASSGGGMRAITRAVRGDGPDGGEGLPNVCFSLFFTQKHNP